jgi:hypothetical protein
MARKAHFVAVVNNLKHVAAVACYRFVGMLIVAFSASEYIA